MTQPKIMTLYLASSCVREVYADARATSGSQSSGCMYVILAPVYFLGAWVRRALDDPAHGHDNRYRPSREDVRRYIENLGDVDG